MPAFAPAHPDELRAACVAAALDRTPPLSCPRIVAAALAGELTDSRGQPLAPAKVPLSSVQWWARIERQRRATLAAEAEPPATTQQRAQDLAARLVTLVGLRVARLEKRGANADPADVQATARAVEQCARAVIATQQQPRASRGNASGRAGAQAPEHEPDTPPDFLAALAQQGYAPDAAPEADADAGSPSTNPAQPTDTSTGVQPEIRVRSGTRMSGNETRSHVPSGRIDVGRGTT